MSMEQSRFAIVLLQWFRQHGRDLPWRNTQDPYPIWLSEIILQQTRVQQGWEYWERFMQRWPNVEALAAATEDEVLRLWQGLGYYSRARNMHFAARQIVAMGGFPNSYEGIRSLKGVGDYTAAAIGSMAFGLPTAVVDGNVYRVLARYFGVDTPINSTEGKKEFSMLAQELLPATDAGTYNQAIMDFGAIQCTPQSPQCMSCPLQESCCALSEGRVSQLPVKLKKLKVKERHLSYIYIRCRNDRGGSPQVAMRRRGSGDIWQGLWEPVNMEEYTPKGTTQLLVKGLKHVLTHRVLYCDFYFQEVKEKPMLPEGYQWIDETDLDQYALPRMMELLFEKLPG